MSALVLLQFTVNVARLDTTGTATRGGGRCAWRGTSNIEGMISMGKVRAKFKVNQVTEHDGGFKQVTLAPVYSTDPNHENKKFWDATPNGQITMGIQNKSASALFEIGKEYYVDFTLVEN
jgi:hypothetical protein